MGWPSAQIGNHRATPRPRQSRQGKMRWRVAIEKKVIGDRDGGRSPKRPPPWIGGGRRLVIERVLWEL